MGSPELLAQARFLLFIIDEGCVAKIGLGHKRSSPDSNLCSNHEEIRYESDLPLNVTFAYSFNLPFPHHTHCLITPDCSTCRLKTEESEPGTNSSFDEPMVLLNEVVEIFTPSQLSAIGEGSFFLQLLDRRRIGWILIDVDYSRR